MVVLFEWCSNLARMPEAAESLGRWFDAKWHDGFPYPRATQGFGEVHETLFLCGGQRNRNSVSYISSGWRGNLLLKSDRVSLWAPGLKQIR